MGAVFDLTSLSRNAGTNHARAAAIAAAFRCAIDEARRFVGATAPNPPVGCTILDAEGQVLAVAAHHRAGELHAEALAIRQCREAGTLDRIHTFVVTLEPCNHTGRTPPCAGAILETPAREVWIGVADPNPVASGGAARLRAAGLAVHRLADLPHPDRDTLLADCADLIGPFVKRTLTGLPWVTVKQALDEAGDMIPPAGRKTFTSEASLKLAHELRRRADAILTGSGTVLADDPEFTVRRVADFPGKRRHLAILDRRARVPEAYVEAAKARGFIVSVEHDLTTALRRLADAGATEVLVEAGPEIVRSVLDGGLWDEHVVIRKSARPGAPDDVTIRRREPVSSPRT
ncbi:diaminohydroxyphosphoribosylaminopyrimidine deaminase [Faunimonas pinastri]|uniref:Riboflavin biosynthesis protein RibD n=1 Tax=Faunimonas pinastri TaxID=1855383 RepID=A0A1H9H2A1_9HYPH|nr:bifunctional diaminohydroxyphosphoribosylaminopyrimidine deaminase/5-amino-6-(5-phosphoribosylamino)uracil reductase RibD [Faunimonas pinastri]SEQ56471.1 diaminohydroxyphosphoribosylaminopyrimidine deaminase [Faunimonas pinastri]